MDKVSYVLPMTVTIQSEDPKEVMRRLNIALRIVSKMLVWI